MESLYYQTLLDDKIKDYDVYISEESQVSEATAIEHLLKNKKYWGDMRIHYENLENKFQENCMTSSHALKGCSFHSQLFASQKAGFPNYSSIIQTVP